MICANSEALRAYEREQEKAEAKVERIDSEIDHIIDEVAHNLKIIADYYDFDYEIIKKMFKNNAKDLL